MTEPLTETTPELELDTDATHPLTDPDAEEAHRNLQFGWALAGLVVLLFAGTVGVAFAYLWLS
jgi:hypothetical protein